MIGLMGPQRVEVMKRTIQERSLDAVMAIFAGPFALPTTILVISL